MRISDEIRIIDLLARREAEFLQVKECEDQIRALLDGNEYPFPPPPVELPSTHRTNAKKAWRPQGMVLPSSGAKKSTRRGTGDAAVAPSALEVDASSQVALPSLIAPTENAYLVHFKEKDTTGTSFLTEKAQVQSLLGLPCESFRVIQVDAVHFLSLDNYQVLRTLWKTSAD